MSKKTLFLFLPIFMIFFVWGLQVGDQFPSKISRVKFDDYHLENEVKVMPNGQRSILLVFISQLDIEYPDLLGVWLLTYLPSEPYTTVLPLFPSYPIEAGKVEKSLRNSFQVQTVNGPPLLNDAFLDQLEEANIWSSGYLLVDLYAVAEAIKLSEGAEYLSLNSNGENIIDDLGKNFEDPFSSFTYQTLLLQHLCGRFTTLDSLSDLDKFMALFPEHISGNIHPEILMKEWRDFIKARNGSFCIFPETEQAAQISK